MDDIKDKIVESFGNKLRLRVCGICFKEDELLLVKHHSLGPKGTLWAPPGGGLTYGESATETLQREFKEETGLNIIVNGFLFVHEFLEKPLHAIELFYSVSIKNGELTTGTDPEMDINSQIIDTVEFVPFKEIIRMDQETLHHTLTLAPSKEGLLSLKGYYINGKLK